MTTFSALQPSSLVEEAYQEIRAAILGGRVATGSQLSEAGIAREMGVSRGPVREALRLLEQAGLVVREPNKGYRVASFTREDLVEFASLRLALEGLALRGAIRDPKTPVELRAIWREMGEATRREDRARAIELDRQFHETLVVRSGHRRLRAVWNQLRDQIELAVAEIALSYPTLSGRAASHVPMLDAIERQDLDGALSALETHIYDSDIFRDAAARAAAREGADGGVGR